MKRIFSVLFALFMVIGCASLGGVFLTGCGKQKTETKGDNFVSAAASGNWSSYYASSYAGGSGTSSSPYLISTAAQLARVAYRVNSGYETSSYFKLTNDIDLSAHYWTSIGKNENTFNGYFDGQYKTITGLTTNAYTITNDYCVEGLFGRSENATLENFSLNQARLNSGAPSNATIWAGFVCGYVGGGTLRNIRVENSNMAPTVNSVSYCFLGGIAGVAASNALIEKCCVIGSTINGGSASSTVSNNSAVGGIAGSSKSTIKDCFFRGHIDVYCCKFGGGIVGWASNEGVASIYSCYYVDTGTAYLGNLISGGIIGVYSSNSGGNIKSCFVDATISNNYTYMNTPPSGTKYIGSIVGQQTRGSIYYSCWYNGKAPNTAYGSKTGGTITGCSGYSSQGLPKSDITGSFYRSSSYLNGTGTNGSEWKTSTWMYDPSQNNGYPILIFSNATYPISFDYNISGVNENLYNPSMVTDSANLTYSSSTGRWTSNNISGNTYSNFKIQKWENNAYVQGSQTDTTTIGILINTFTKSVTNTKTRIGFNGNNYDATIIIDVSCLQNGTYTVSAELFNFSVSASGGTFGNIKIEKSSTYTNYTEPARDKRVGETYGTLPTYSSRTGYTLGNWYRKKNYLDMDAMMNYMNQYQSNSAYKYQKDADGTYSWCPSSASTDNGYRIFPVSLTNGGRYRLSYMARAESTGEGYTTSLSPISTSKQWYGNAYNDCYVINDTTWRWYETTFTVGSDFGGFSSGWWGGGRTFFKNIRLERIDIEDAEATIYSTTAQPKMAGHKLYARWSPNTYTVSFNANGGTGTMSSRTWSYDTWYTVSNSFSRTGYTFSGWQISTGSSVTHYYGTSTSSYSTTTNTTWTYNNAGTSYFKNLRSSSGTVNMYAQWTPNTYTVSFDAPNLWEEYGSSTSGASANFSHYVDDYGQKFTSCEITEYSGGGVYFYKERLTVGERYVWKVDLKSNKTHTIKTIGHEQGAFESLNVNSDWQTLTHEFVASDTTYNAFVIYDGLEVGEVLEVANLTIQKKSDISGDGAIESLKKSFGKSYGFLPTPTKANYTFGGWWTSASGGTQVTSSSTNLTAGNQILYAHWTPNAVTHSVNLRVISPDGKSVTETTLGGTVRVEGYQISGMSSSFKELTRSQTLISASYSVHSGQQFKITAMANQGFVFAGFSTASTPSDVIKNPTSPPTNHSSYYSTNNNNYYVYFKQVSANQLKYDETDKYFYFEDGYYPQSEVSVPSATANGEKFTYNDGSQNVTIPVYENGSERYVKIEKNGTTKWFKFEPIRWRISDYGVEKTETNYIKYEALRKYTGYATNFTAVSDLILGVGAMHNTREVREGTSVTSMKGFQLVEETTDGCSITFQYAKSGNVIKVDNYSTSSQNNAVSTGTTAYSAPLRIASLEEITSLGLVNKGARASDMVAFILGQDKNNVTYWTRDLSNLGSGVAITSTGTKVQTWLNQLQGMRFAYTFSEGSNAGGGDLEFDRLNYIESTGTQYIDTGVYVGAKTSVVSDFQFTITNQQARIFGVTGSGIGEMEFVVYISSGNVFSWACGDSSYNWTNISADTKRHTFELNAKTKKFLIDDGKTCEYDTSNVVRNTGSVTLTLFTQKEHTGLINEGAFAQGARMYGTKIYEDDVLVRDFVPVRRVLTGEVGLLDNVSGRFFGNSGTGNFVAG